jgi:hypothetical protein
VVLGPASRSIDERRQHSFGGGGETGNFVTDLRLAPSEWLCHRGMNCLLHSNNEIMGSNPTGKHGSLSAFRLFEFTCIDSSLQQG